MMKKLLCLMLTACLILSLAACSGTAEEDSGEDVPKSEQTGTAGSSMPIKDNQEEAEKQILIAMQ